MSLNGYEETSQIFGSTSVVPPIADIPATRSEAEVTSEVTRRGLDFRF